MHARYKQSAKNHCFNIDIYISCDLYRPYTDPYIMLEGVCEWKGGGDSGAEMLTDLVVWLHGAFMIYSTSNYSDINKICTQMPNMHI